MLYPLSYEGGGRRAAGTIVAHAAGRRRTGCRPVANPRSLAAEAIPHRHGGSTRPVGCAETWDHLLHQKSVGAHAPPPVGSSDRQSGRRVVVSGAPSGHNALMDVAAGTPGPTVGDVEQPRGFTELPVVDLGRWDGGTSSTVAHEVREICHHVGFLQLVGHGLDIATRQRYFDELARFFALPESVKARIDKANSPHFRGWERIGAELTDNKVDHREQLDLATAYPPHRVKRTHPAYLVLDGPNQWLPEDVLPGFRAVVEDVIDRLAGVAAQVLELLGAALELQPGHFARAFGERPFSLAKLISYPPTPAGAAGVNAHHDSGFLTLLLQHRVGGLQVRDADGGWIDVPVRDDVIIVNLGETLQRLTGNYFVATDHRVVTSHPRLSSAFFAGPDLRTRLDPLPLPHSFAAAVAASPRHRDAGFMARRDELLAGRGGTSSTSTEVFGEQLWNYYCRSYPDNVRRHYPHALR